MLPDILQMRLRHDKSVVSIGRQLYDVIAHRSIYIHRRCPRSITCIYIYICVIEYVQLNTLSPRKWVPASYIVIVKVVSQACLSHAVRPGFGNRLSQCRWYTYLYRRDSCRLTGRCQIARTNHMRAWSSPVRFAAMVLKWWFGACLASHTPPEQRAYRLLPRLGRAVRSRCFPK